MRIVVDAMGSDDYPQPDVVGAVQAARLLNIEIVLVGDQARIQPVLASQNLTGLTVDVVHADQQIVMTDKPSEIIKSKPNSSMHVGLQLVRDGAADAFVTAGHTGAALGISMLRQVGLGRLPGVKRPALGVVFPTAERPFLIDDGANADCRPEYLLQFAIMGSLYMQKMEGIAAPTVALVSNGEEEGKGNRLIQEAGPLLAASNLNFIGNVEPKDFMRGKADVAVTDGFTGNLMLKMAEATAAYMSNLIRQELTANPISMLGGLMTRTAFKRVRRRLDPDEVGGAPLLGINGVVIVGHGRSTAYAIQQAVTQAHQAVKQQIVAAIRDGIAQSG